METLSGFGILNHLLENVFFQLISLNNLSRQNRSNATQDYEIKFMLMVFAISPCHKRE